MATGTISAFQVCAASKRIEAERQDHQAADHGDAAMALGESRLATVDVRSPPGNRARRPATRIPRPRADRSPKLSSRIGRVVLEAKQDELLFADCLPGFDQNLAAAVDVVTVRDAVACLVAKLGGRVGLECQRRERLQLAGDQVEQDLADARGGEGRLEFLGDRPRRA